MICLPAGLPPYVWDQASSVMARGEVELHERDGLPLPFEGVGVDPQGLASSDPSQILAGAQLPFGLHKGANIACMIELLSASLFGSDLAVDKPDGTPFDEYNRGLFFLAIDPSNLRESGDPIEHGEALMKALIGIGDTSRLPGDRRRAHRSRVLDDKQPIEIPEALHCQIKEIVAACTEDATRANMEEPSYSSSRDGGKEPS